MGPNLKISINEGADPTYTIITFDGEFDKAGHVEVRPTLETCVNSFAKKFLILDFADLTFINSEGIGYLMEMHTHLVQRDMQLIVIGLADHVKDVFQTIGISEIIPLYQNIEAFLNRSKV